MMMRERNHLLEFFFPYFFTNNDACMDGFWRFVSSALETDNIGAWMDAYEMEFDIGEID